MRTTLGQLALSDFPRAVGLCDGDLPGIARAANRAQQVLINKGGETGWFGGWQKVAFQVTRCFPYITLPRALARVINMDVCRFPIRIQNEFYEFLEAGIGLQDFTLCRDWCGALEGYERGVWPTMVDLTPTNQFLRLYTTDARDVGKRVLFGPALDQNSNNIYSQDGANSVNGFYMTLGPSMVTNPFIVTNIGGIQKDATYGDVLLTQVDATSGAEVVLSRYAPDETTPAYRRYFIKRLPCGCEPIPAQSPCIAPLTVPPFVTVTAMAKLEFIPANRATDFLIIGNIPALIEQAKANRYSDMDTAQAQQMAEVNGARAIKYLNDELRHYLGELQPAVNVAPFGTAHLCKPMYAVRHG